LCLFKALLRTYRATRFPLFRVEISRPAKPARFGRQDGFGRLVVSKQIQ
jgi:hypothetical protein